MSSCSNGAEWNMTNAIFGNYPPPLPGRIFAGALPGALPPANFRQPFGLMVCKAAENLIELNQFLGLFHDRH
jgi:hypothetical protein